MKISVTKTRKEVDLQLKELDTVTNINNLTYTVRLYDKNLFEDVHSVQSINLNQNDIYKYQYYHGFDEKGKEKSFVYFINSPYEELFINVVFHFTIDSNNEESFYSYNAEEIKEKEIALTDQIQN